MRPTPAIDDRQGDLSVVPISAALQGKVLDVVVSGSIGAVEAVRFIRSLRRLGASVTPWLTEGGAQFTTPMALEWAAGQQVRRGFAGDAPHIATADAVIIAPASANFLGQVANGLLPTAATALVASYLGQKLPVLFLPNMHDSLAAAPAVQRNIATLTAMGAYPLAARLEEGKHKFPEPAVLADLVAHRLNCRPHRVLITLGTTRAAIDAVRYLSNYSSGRLGSLIAEELFRRGFDTRVVAGPCPVQPKTFGRLHAVVGNADMEEAARRELLGCASAAVFAASVMDFLPTTAHTGKIASRDHERLTVELQRTHKMIKSLNPPLVGGARVKVGFKLETALTPERAEALAARHMPDYDLSLMVVNDLADVDANRHRALLFERRGGTIATPGLAVDGKEAVALLIAEHVAARLRNAGERPTHADH